MAVCEANFAMGPEACKWKAHCCPSISQRREREKPFLLANLAPKAGKCSQETTANCWELFLSTNQSAEDSVEIPRQEMWETLADARCQEWHEIIIYIYTVIPGCISLEKKTSCGSAQVMSPTQWPQASCAMDPGMRHRADRWTSKWWPKPRRGADHGRGTGECGARRLRVAAEGCQSEKRSFRLSGLCRARTGREFWDEVKRPGRRLGESQ